MRINPKENIAGFPLLKIRDLLKRNNSLNPDIAANSLKIHIKDAKVLLQKLTELGYLEITKDNKYITHQNTLKGNSLALAKAVPLLAKEKAEKFFADFMKRVKEVNNNPYYLYKVDKVILFGSFITDVATVNDIDIAIEIVRKDTDSNIWQANHDKRIDEAFEKGVRFNGLIDELYYPEKEVRLFLKAKSKYLSFHSLDDEILTRTLTRQVYP